MSKQKEQGTGSRLFHKRLAIKTTIQFITIIILFEVAYILLNLLFLIIMGVTNLDQTEAFQAFKPFLIPIMVVVSIAGCSYISYRFMLRPLEHLDEVAEAAQKLAHPTDAPIIKKLFHIFKSGRQLIFLFGIFEIAEAIVTVPIEILFGSFFVNVFAVGNVKTAVIVLRIINAILSGSSIVSC